MNRFAEYPFVRILIPFIAGILITTYFVPLNYFFKILFLALIVFYFLDFYFFQIFNHFNNRLINGIYLSVLFLFFGMYWTDSLNHKHHAFHFKNYLQKENDFIVEVLDQPQEKEKSIKLKVRVLSMKSNQSWIKTAGHSLLYIQQNDQAKKIKYGDQLLVRTNFNEISAPKNPGEFNYRQYCYFNRIYHQAYASNGKWQVLGNHAQSIFGFAIESREKLLDILERVGLKDQDLAVASALILGYTDDLNIETRTAYSSSGALHVLAVSGLHVAIIYTVLDKLLMFLVYLKRGNYWKAFLILLLLWLYALLTGMSPSVIRAATMLSFIVIAKTINRNANIYNTISASAFCILCFDPFMLMEVGFQLSYLAVIGIIYLQPKIYQLFYFKNRVVDFVWNISAVSIAAQIATFPLGILYFHQFPNYFLLSNLIVIPLGTIILYVGILALIFSSIPFLGFCFAAVLKFSIGVLNSCVMWIEHLPYALTTGFSISIFECYLIYVCILIFILFLIYKRAILLQFTFLMVSILFISFAVEKWEQKNQHLIVFYSIKNATAIDFIEGDSSLFLAHPGLVGEQSKMKFHIQHNWFDRGIRHLDTLYLPTLFIQNDHFFAYNHFYEFNGHRIFHWDSTIKMQKSIKKIKVNTILVSNNTRMDWKILENNFEFDQLILDGTNSNYYLVETKKKISNKTKVIDLIEAGAYENDL